VAAAVEANAGGRRCLHQPHTMRTNHPWTNRHLLKQPTLTDPVPPACMQTARGHPSSRHRPTGWQPGASWSPAAAGEEVEEGGWEALTQTCRQGSTQAPARMPSLPDSALQSVGNAGGPCNGGHHLALAPCVCLLPPGSLCGEQELNTSSTCSSPCPLGTSQIAPVAVLAEADHQVLCAPLLQGRVPGAHARGGRRGAAPGWGRRARGGCRGGRQAAGHRVRRDAKGELQHHHRRSEPREGERGLPLLGPVKQPRKLQQ